MSGRGEPPEGGRGSGPGGEDEFRIVFDEQFVRAAVLHEPSAHERMRTGRGPRSLRRILGVPVGTFRVGILMLSVVLVLAGALYLGARRGGTPAARTASGPAVLVRVSLAPAPGVPSAAPVSGADPFAGTEAAGWPESGAGVLPPDRDETDGFSPPQVIQGLALVRQFVVGTQLDPEVWRGVRPWAVALSLEPDQYAQLIGSLEHPADDDTHSATGWVTRFDPQQVAVPEIRVRLTATTTVDETVHGELTVTVDGVFAYAVKAATADTWTRFVVHRVWEFEIDKPGLRHAKMRVRRIVTIAAPQACAADSAAFFRPVFAVPGTNGSAGAPGSPVVTGPETASAGVPAAPGVPPQDPLGLGGGTGTLCGTLATAV